MIYDVTRFGYTQQLDRKVEFWQLVAFGLNYMIPLSPAIFFGFVLVQSGGTVALPFIIGGIAIFFTALSYTIMVLHFPLAGSVYNFIAQIWNKPTGFIAGWVLLLDYLFITTVTSMSASLYITQILPVHYLPVLITFVLFTGIVNLFGIKIVTWVGIIFLILAEVVVITSFIVWSHAIIQNTGHFSALFNWSAFHFTNIHTLMNATSLAVASYLGFDAMTTLAEEVRKPLKVFPKAIIWCVFIGGLGMTLTGYLGVLACPNWQTLMQQPGWQDTALFHISVAAGGTKFATFYSIGFVISMAVFNLVATATTARLLFGMGRDGMINKAIFAAVGKRWKTPYWNILIVMLMSVVVGALCKVDQIANLVNYGALFGFGWLNLAVIWLFISKQQMIEYHSTMKNSLHYIIFPLLGFSVVAWLFVSLDHLTLVVGSSWLVLGLLYLVIFGKSKLR
jgi:putrescine importer